MVFYLWRELPNMLSTNANGIGSMAARQTLI